MEKIEFNKQSKINGYDVIDDTIEEKKLDYYTDVFSPGETKEQLEIGREVKGKLQSSITGLKSVASATVPYDVEITGVGFKPKSIMINATPATSGHCVYSNGYATEGSTGNCIYAHDNSDTIFSGTSYDGANVVNLEWKSGASYPDIQCQLKEMTSDGFILTVTRNDGNNSFYFNYLCV